MTKPNEFRPRLVLKPSEISMWIRGKKFHLLQVSTLEEFREQAVEALRPLTNLREDPDVIGKLVTFRALFETEELPGVFFPVGYNLSLYDYTQFSNPLICLDEAWYHLTSPRSVTPVCKSTVSPEQLKELGDAS